jgi:hypothetical protein
VLDHQKLVYDLTMEYARKVIGDNAKDLKVIFSNKLNGVQGTCYPFIKTIIYCDGHMKLNKNNLDALKYTVVEECAHLIRLPHDEEFYKICIDMGFDVSKPPDGIKYYWKFLKRCEKCGNEKFYNRKPYNLLCENCGQVATILYGVIE